MTEAHLAPRARRQPIHDAATALEVIHLAVHLPPRDETIVVVVDDDRCGTTIAIVAGTERPDDVVEVVECLATAAAGAPDVAGLIVASVRPGTTEIDPDDPDRWVELSVLCDDLGLDLVEWFVVGDEVRCPRDDLGERPRW